MRRDLGEDGGGVGKPPGAGRSMAPSEKAGDLPFHGGWVGALTPFLVFLAGVSWLGLSGAPDEMGFGPVLLVAIGVGFLLARDREAYADAVIDGMSHRLVMLLVLAWLLAGVLGTVLRESGLVQSLVWAASAGDVHGGGFVAATFLVCAVFSTATGTSLGTILICAPLLYPAAAPLGGDPAFTIGAVLAGATFGDNVSPISDTTIASAATQDADLGGVVRSRMRYALPAAALALLVFGLFGGATGAATGAMEVEGDAAGLLMLLVPVLVLALLLRRRHLAVGLFSGIGFGVVLALVLGRFRLDDLLFIDADAFVASGILLEGMSRAFGVSIFTILLMGLVGGLEASGLLRRVIAWMEARARSGTGAGWWIFASISTATLLTTHSAVAILTVGPLTKSVGEGAGIGRYRRANILDVTVCTYPFLLPFFIPTILAASMTGGGGMAVVTPWEVGLHNVHSWGLLAAVLVSLVWPGRGEAR